MTTPPQPPVAPASTLSARLNARLQNSPRLVPDFFWTLSGNLLSAISGIVVFKIITKFLPAAEYGQASLVLGIVGLLSQLVAGPVITAHLRLYFEHVQSGMAAQYVRAVRLLLLRTAAVMSAVYLVIAGAYRARGNTIYLALALSAVLLLFTQTQLTGTFSFLEAQKRYRANTFAQSLSKVLQIPFLLALLFTALPRASSVILAQALTAVTVVVAWWIRSNSPRPSGKTALSDLSVRAITDSARKTFGWSIYWFSLFSWVMATSDRYFIEHFRTAAEVGIYAINYGLWSVPYLALSAWLDTLVRSRMFEKAEKQDWAGVRQLLLGRFALALGLGTALSLVIYLWGKQIAVPVIGERYWHSRELTVLICTAHLLYVTGISFYNFFIAVKRVDVMMKIAGIAAIINVGANLMVVPRYGALGAGLSTLVAYVAMSAMMMIAGSVVFIRTASPNRS